MAAERIDCMFCGKVLVTIINGERTEILKNQSPIKYVCKWCYGQGKPWRSNSTMPPTLPRFWEGAEDNNGN